MKISVFGLGYVGTISSGCLANDGHEVIGVDPSKTKVDLINKGMPSIIEKDIGEMIAGCVSNGLLSASQDINSAVSGSEISMICVGTPSQMNGSLDLGYVKTVCEEIGAALKEKDDFHIILVRSTMLPGTMNNVVIPALEEFSGKKAGADFGVCHNPEFLREGTAVFDYYHPPITVIGESDTRAGDVLEEIYGGLAASLIRTDIETAEMVKYTANVWHALKVSFANEIGNICKKVGIDGQDVMNIFGQDTKLNLSFNYMNPGFAFGGACLPKDVRALAYKARTLDIDVPVISSIMHSNERQVKTGLSMITEKRNKKVGFLGFSFKAGTDDLRESPMVEVIESLLGKGYDIRLYDRNVKVASLIGANKNYILNTIPHISSLMVDSIETVLEHAETIVIGNNSEEFRDILSMTKDNQVVVDLVRISSQRSVKGKYDGICW